MLEIIFLGVREQMYGCYADESVIGTAKSGKTGLIEMSDAWSVIFRLG